MISVKLHQDLVNTLDQNWIQDMVKHVNGKPCITIPETNYMELLRDFSDDEVASALEESNADYWFDLRDHLIAKEKDEDVKAHLLGYESAAAQKEFIERVKAKVTIHGEAGELKGSWHDDLIGGKL